MTKNLVFTVLIFLLAHGVSRADSLAETLKKDYQHQVLGLRTPFQHGDQEFDAAGKPLKDFERGDWQARGGILIQEVRVEAGALLLKGPQAAYGYVARNKDNKNKKHDKHDKKEFEPGIIPLEKPITVVVHLDHLLATEEEAREILDRVFFLADNSREQWLPQYQRSGRIAPSDQPIYVPNQHHQPKIVPPYPIYQPDPEYSDKAREHKYQGLVVFKIIVDKKGEVTWIQLERALGMGLDEKALQSLKTWKFKPAKLNGEAVPVSVAVEMSFNLFE